MIGRPLGEREVQATLVQGGGDWEERERLLISLVDELHDTSRLSDALWQKMAASYRPEQIIEMIALAGFYHSISFFTNGLQIECESFAPRFATHDAPV
jgi:4-carboxymuconolactone decarboxylase